MKNFSSDFDGELAPSTALPLVDAFAYPRYSMHTALPVYVGKKGAVIDYCRHIDSARAA